IFTRTKRTAQKVADDLAERGFKVGAVHGDLGQVAREKALKRFRDGTIDVLVATDVAARGIDIDDVTHVINYQCPEDDKTYVHRIGRTGRAGRTGIAVTLVDWDELHRWELIDKALSLGIPDPPETYSTSEHLRSDLSIDESKTGRIAAAKPPRDPDETRETRADREPRKRSTRTRRRTRGGQTDANGTSTESAAETTTTETTTTESGSDTSAGDGTAKPRRRRRRRGGANRKPAGEQTAASDAGASESTAAVAD
ncbi:C-terminal helicase domain-containing protein, partial [uncultured Gordonia sp.]